MTNYHNKLIDEITICLNRIDDNDYSNADLETIYNDLRNLLEEIGRKETK